MRVSLVSGKVCVTHNNIILSELFTNCGLNLLETFPSELIIYICYTIAIRLIILSNYLVVDRIRTDWPITTPLSLKYILA